MLGNSTKLYQMKPFNSTEMTYNVKKKHFDSKSSSRKEWNCESNTTKIHRRYIKCAIDSICKRRMNEMPIERMHCILFNSSYQFVQIELTVSYFGFSLGTYNVKTQRNNCFHLLRCLRRQRICLWFNDASDNVSHSVHSI